MDRFSFSPTAYFAVACTAFSLLAVTTAWKNQQSISSANNKPEPTKSHARPRPDPRQRVAVDSLYISSSREASDILEVPSRDRTPTAILADLIQRCARLAQLLRSAQSAHESRITVASLLGELSLLTTTLSKLQHILTQSSSPFSGKDAQSACFTATTSSLTETFMFLDSALNDNQGASHVAALQQLRDQRPTLAYLIESLGPNTSPPTPPAELETNAFLQPGPSEGMSFMHPITPSTGLTPGVDAKGWLEPPPEYSPPAQGSAVAIAAEKSDVKHAEAAPPQQQPEVEDEVYDHDALYNAVTDDDIDLVTELLALGSDPGAPIGELHRTALHQAAHLNHTSCLTTLLRKGASLTAEDSEGDTPLHLAAWAGHVEALSALLAHGADVDWLSGRDGYSPLWCAISAYNIDAARLLLKHGARVSLRSASGGGLTPLHQAAVTGQSAMCELLLDRGAQVDTTDEESNTPLHYAAASGSAASVKILLRSGADVTASQKQGLTPAHWAAHKGHMEVLKMLLSYGAPVNAKAEEGATPLHLASNRGHLPAVKLLLENGADTKVKATWDGASGTPAAMAKAKGHVRVVRLLQSC